jgi:hypothetical protein
MVVVPSKDLLIPGMAEGRRARKEKIFVLT